jgi:hypothetical protein
MGSSKPAAPLIQGDRVGAGALLGDGPCKRDGGPERIASRSGGRLASAGTALTTSTCAPKAAASSAALSAARLEGAGDASPQPKAIDASPQPKAIDASPQPEAILAIEPIERRRSRRRGAESRWSTRTGVCRVERRVLRAVPKGR